MNHQSQSIWTSRILLIGTLLACLAAAVLGGCGSGSSSATADGSSATINKAELISQADAICHKTDEIQKASLAAYKKERSSGPLELTNEQLMIKFGFPPIKAEIKELQDLGAPKADKAMIAKWLHELREALRSSERNPKLFIQVGGRPEFNKADELAKKYGFKDCADAL